MNTLSIWYEKKEEYAHKDVKLDLHFNFWKLGKQQLLKEYTYFLDIGLKVENFKGVAKVKMFFPFPLSRAAVTDLGSIISNSTDLVNAIFNEEFKIINIGHEKYRDLVHQESKKSFSIYTIDVKNDIEIKEKYGGSIVELDTGAIKYSDIKDTCYFRFRITLDSLKQFTHLYTPKYSFFQSAFSQTEIIDFRVNEKRNLDKSLLQEMDGKGSFLINKVHFLLLRNAEDNFAYAHNDTSSCRVLEEKIWDEYIDIKYKEEKIIAYHWKKKGGIDSFNAFAKMDFKKNNLKTITMYLIVIIALSVLVNLLSSFLFESFNKEKLDTKPGSAIIYKSEKNERK